MEQARLVITDSGGIQEETTYLGVPCLTARPNTERPVTIQMGTNRLVESQQAVLITTAREIIQTNDYMAGKQPPPLWDGAAAGRIVATLKNKFQ
jgi:UDP-N-acetylglucosamine 2-epimerase (non-hydrolysing)